MRSGLSIVTRRNGAVVREPRTRKDQDRITESKHCQKLDCHICLQQDASISLDHLYRSVPVLLPFLVPHMRECSCWRTIQEYVRLAWARLDGAMTEVAFLRGEYVLVPIDESGSCYWA
jgi:hypothetical protein